MIIHTEHELDFDHCVHLPFTGGPLIHILHILGQFCFINFGFFWHCPIDSQYAQFVSVSVQSPPGAGGVTICTVSMNGLIDVTGRMYDIGISGLPGKIKCQIK